MKSHLFPQLQKHLSDLSSRDLAGSADPYKTESDTIAEIIKAKLKSDKQVSVVVVCTGNSRRSMMAAAMGNAAAAFYGVQRVRFFSGGTTPSAFNPRAIRALKEIGFQITATGNKASPGPKGDENPIYRVKWGDMTSLESQEFSKIYSDSVNPNKDFIALMVCDEANKECPLVRGAKTRFAIPFEDPKKYDGTPEEASKYAERRDDLGRFTLRLLKTVSSNTTSNF